MNPSRLRPEIVAMLTLGLPLIGSHVARTAIGVADTVMVLSLIHI